jgi:hypothetical protein
MAKPVDKAGRSARDIAREKVDTETMVAMEYLLYKGMDLKSLVMAKAKTLEAQELRKKLGGSSSGKKLSGAGSTQTKRPVQLPDLKDLL